MRYIYISIFLLIANISLASELLVVVGGVAITSADVDKRITALKLVNPQMPVDEATRTYILTLLINEELYHNESERLKISATPEEISEQLKDLKIDHHLTDAQAKIFSTNNSLKKQIESQVVWAKLVNMVFRSKVKISDAELRDEQKIKTEEVKAVVFKQIALNSSNIAKVEKLTSTNCEQLDQTAMELGLGRPYKVALSINELNPDLQQIVRGLPVNKLSELLNVQGQMQVIMVCHKDVTAIARNNKDIENELSSRKMHAEATKYLAELKKRICIEYHK